jgi:ABC-type uncharacterized transport system involved in gliding motility auxiliary subunit
MRFFRNGAPAEPRRVRSWIGLCCVMLLLVAANVLAARFLPGRIDLTAERLYTLSPGTSETLGHIEEPVTLRFYYSTRLGGAVPSYGVYAQRVRELLDQYAAAAHGKIRLEVYDPQPFSDAEDRALAFGLQAVPLNARNEQVYFGLAGTNSTDDLQTIAFFQPQRERLLEYELTRIVHALAVPKRTTIGLISLLPLDGNPMAALQGDPAAPLAILQQLRQLDDVKALPATLDAIPAGIDVVMLVHPQKLPARTLFAIDQFVLRGGKALVFVDPYSELQARGAEVETAHDSNLEPLFRAWGLRLVPNTVAADRRDARRVVVPAGAGSGELHYIGWINLRESEIDRDDPITANLRQVTMASAGILEPIAGATTRFEPLLTTSPDSMAIPAGKVAGLPDVVGLLMRFKPSDTRYVLAAHVTGPADTAFPEGPPKDQAAAKPGEPPPAAAAFLRKSVAPINVVAVADTDLLDDKFWAQTQEFFGRQVIVPVAGNGDFVANAVEVLAGGEDLVGLRSRGTSARPFEIVKRIQSAADERYAAEQQSLEEKLKTTEAKLRDMTTEEGANANAPLSPEQEKAVEQFRADMLATRRELRNVRGALRQDIEWLKALLEFCDIALVPILVAVAAIVLGALRRRRWRRAAARA